MGRRDAFCYAGVDAGSRTVKCVLVDAQGRVLARSLLDQGPRQAERARAALKMALQAAGLGRRRVRRTVATGYGRDAVTADERITEITCHARGASHVAPGVRTVIDIGGQDSKVIRLDAAGNVRDFAMNDRCAAGTGCFLEVAARRLGMSVVAFGASARRSRKPSLVSSMCVVFAETEMVGLLAAGEKARDVAAGVERAAAARISSLLGGRLAEPVAFTGGVALVPGMAEALSRSLGVRVRIASEPQMAGALGAALLALESGGAARPGATPSSRRAG